MRPEADVADHRLRTLAISRRGSGLHCATGPLIPERPRVLNFPVVGQNERGMVFFSADKHDNHHQLALVPAKEGVAMPDPDSVGMHHVSFELGTFAELQEAYRMFKEKGVPICHTTFHGVSKSVYFNDPDGNMLEVYVNVPEEEYRKSVPNPYSRYGSIDDELAGNTEQKAGTVAP